jgi:cytochrome b561
MTLFYLLLALGIAVLLNLASRWARLAGQALAAIALFFNIWSIWLALADGTFAAATAAGQGARVLALEAMGVVGAAALLALALLLPRQMRAAAPLGWRNDGTSFGLASRLLHWTSAVLMLCALPMGLFVVVLPQGAIRADFLAGHQGVGLAVLALLLLRLGWLAASRPPAAPGVAAGLARGAFYALLAALPLTGLALAGATGWPVLGSHLTELVPLPLARALHILLSALFALLFAAHVGAVISHQRRTLPLLPRMLR